MPTSGQDILRRIMEFAASAGEVEKSARQAAHATSEEIDRLMTSQTEAARELAQLYLPRLNDDVDRDGWSEMRATLQSIILRKEDARRQLLTRFHQMEAQRSAVEARWTQLNDRATQLTVQSDRLAKQFSDAMANDAEFQSLSRQAAEGQARLEQAEANLLQVEKDAKNKLPDYQRSRLFQYLHRCEFGTDRYSRRGLTRRLDRWVSRLIDFPRAAAGYRFLSSAPRQMKQVIDEQRRSVKQCMDQVEQRHNAAAVALGLPQVQADAAKVRGELESAAAATESARKGEELAQQQLAELDSPDCQFYRDALKAFQSLIQKTERSLISARAAQTPELTDDQVAARLKHLDDQVSEKRNQLAQLSAAADEAASRTARIHDLASKCRRAQFDHPRRVFDDQLDLQTHLESLLAGKVDADRVYQEMYRRQHLDSPIADQAAAALEGPMAQMLLQTMAHAAGAALGTYAARAGQQHRLRKNRD